MLFGTKDVQEQKSRWIRPGVHNEVIIDSVSGVMADKPYLEFKFRLPEGTSEDATAARMYIHTKPSLNLNLGRIKHIAKGVVKLEEIDSIEGADVLDYGEKLNKLLAGRKLRMKWNGEEYVGKDGKIKTRAVLPVNNFVEAITTSAEYPVISDSATMLKFDPAKDIVKLSEEKRAQLVHDEGGAADDDLPW